MDNFDTVKSVETDDHLVKNAPNIFLFHESVGLLEVIYLRLEITSISIFHDNAQSLGTLLKKSLFVCNDIRMIDGCQDSDLIQCVIFLFVIEFPKFDLY